MLRHGRRQRRHLRQGRQAKPLQAHGPRIVRGRIEHHRPVGCALCDARLDGRRARVPARARGGSALCTCARRGQRRCRRSRRRRSAGLQQGGPAAGPAAAGPPCCDPGRPGDPGSPQRIGTMSSAADRWTAGVTEGGSAVVIGRSPSSGVACSGAAGHQEPAELGISRRLSCGRLRRDRLRYCRREVRGGGAGVDVGNGAVLGTAAGHVGRGRDVRAGRFHAR